MKIPPLKKGVDECREAGGFCSVRTTSRFFIRISIFILSFMVSTAFATKFAEPAAAHIFSSNKKFYIDFKPEAHVQKVVKVNPHQIKNIWSFSYPVAMDDVLFLSNNGKRVYVVRSKYVKTDDLNKPAIFIFNSNGLQKTYSYREISIPRKYHPNEMGPIGDFWRIWRGSVTIQQGFLVIHTETLTQPSPTSFY